MKKLLTLFAILFLTVVSAQEKKTIKHIDKDLYQITIEHSHGLLDQGFLKLKGDKLINHGKWKRYDSNGELKLVVLYLEGRKVSASRYEEAVVYTIKSRL